MRESHAKCVRLGSPDVGGINMVKFFHNFFTLEFVAGILILRMMDVTWTGKYTVFSFYSNK